MSEIACGIDIGGSAVKGGLVNLNDGALTSQIVRIETPQLSTPDAVADVTRQVIERLAPPSDSPIGVAIPAPVIHDVLPFMANLDPSWNGINVRRVMEKHIGKNVTVLNDADAAGMAEIAFGAAKNIPGTIIVTTLGTGIGSAVIINGMLIPNTELGHIEIDGHDAETRASAAVKTAENLSWETWAQRLNNYYSQLEILFSPDLFVIGGGVSAVHEKFLHLLKLKTKLVPAQLFNTAGIVGAGYYAAVQKNNK